MRDTKVLFHHTFKGVGGRHCGPDDMVLGFTTTYCNQCLSPITLWVRILLMVRCTRYNNNIMWKSLSVTCRRSVYGFLRILLFSPPMFIIHTIEHSSHFHPYKYSPDNDWCIPKYTEHLYEPWLGQIKDYEIGICCFSVKHAALRSKSKHWLHRNQNNVWEWSDMSTHRLLFQWARIISIKTQLEVWWSRTKRTSSSFHWM
jgi:hypothetical protein